LDYQKLYKNAEKIISILGVEIYLFIPLLYEDTRKLTSL